MAKPSEWTRTTSGADPARLDADVLAAIAATAERERFEADPLARARAVTTVSEREKRRLLGSRTERSETVLLLSEEWLTVAVRLDDGAVVVSFLPLDSIDVRPFRSELIEDTGLEVIGVAYGATERANRFVPLDEGPAGREFRSELERAVAAA
ncbi:hypothetical protein HJD18_03140 [Thermoleophilia bacterium SCSIO 60948]|nr:hypothetical protein HJD18_03140 [Thermoleophilia bacterium SCSIO 60948]